MPEEINRTLTDAIADYLFVTEPSGIDNLHREGCAPDRVFLVGNVMIDTLLARADEAKRACPWTAFEGSERRYAVATLHRPSNVDDPERLRRLWNALCLASVRLPIVLPLHPRTRSQVQALDLRAPRNLRVCDPLPYMTFLGLLAGARVVLTDSGGIQEETTVLGVPCLTLRDNTERPITVALGTNRVVGTDVSRITPELDHVLAAAMPEPRSLPLWDGQAAERIVDILERDLVEGRFANPLPDPLLHA
jgi:UDP-N-acetylglucosamine 2-epimerase (non-hydrolysing)